MPDEVIDDFWTASELNAVTLGEFVSRLNSYQPTAEAPQAWVRTGSPHPLAAGPLVRRRSERRFGERDLTNEELGKVFAAFAADEHGRRPYAAAGALYGVHAIGFLLGCEHELRGRIVAHHPTQHALYDIGPSPGWSELAELIGGRDTQEPPALAIALFLDEAAVRIKYGVRGARFALLEAGAALHQLGLATADAGLVGYASGGGQDAALRYLAGLPRSARFIASYLAGPGPLGPRSARFGAGERLRRWIRARRVTAE